MSLSKKINPSLVLIQPRKTRPFITERLLMGRKESNKKNITKQGANTKQAINGSSTKQWTTATEPLNNRNELEA